MKYLRQILIWGVITLGQGFILSYGQQKYPGFSCLLEEFPENRSFFGQFRGPADAVCQITWEVDEVTQYGTGVLVNNTNNDGRMLILTTASHMPANDDGTYKTEEDINTALERYNFIFFKEDLLCNGGSPVPDSEILTFTGARLLALYSDTKNHINGELLQTDIALLELDIPNLDTQPLAKNLYFAGWNVRPRASYQFSSEGDFDDQEQPPINQNTEIGVGGLVIGHPMENDGSYYKKVAIINSAIKERPVQWVAGGILITGAIVDEDEMNHYIFDDPDGFHSINIFNRPFIENNSAYGSPWFNKYGEVAAIYSTHKPHIPASVGTFSIATALSAVWNKGEKPLRDFLAPNNEEIGFVSGGKYCNEGKDGAPYPQELIVINDDIENGESLSGTAKYIFVKDANAEPNSTLDLYAHTTELEEGTEFNKDSSVDIKSKPDEDNTQILGCVTPCYSIDVANTNPVLQINDGKLHLLNAENIHTVEINFISSSTGRIPNNIPEFFVLGDNPIELFDLAELGVTTDSNAILEFEVILRNPCDEISISLEDVEITQSDKETAYTTYAEPMTDISQTQYLANKLALTTDYEYNSDTTGMPAHWEIPEDVEFKVETSSYFPYATAYSFSDRFRPDGNEDDSWNPGTRRIRGVEGEERDWFTNYATLGKLKMKIYYPKIRDDRTLDAVAPLPIILYMTGGGFLNIDYRLRDATCEWLAQKGYVVVNMEYRTGAVLWNFELTKRAIMRAWQDLRALVTYWRYYTTKTGTREINDLPIKLDNNKIFGLGWSAGGVTMLNNILISKQIFELLSQPGQDLASVSDGYQYPQRHGPNRLHSAYGLTNFKTVPCIGNDDDGGCMLTDSGRVIDTNIQQYLDGADGLLDGAISFSGAVAKEELMGNKPPNVPLADIHHELDQIVPFNKGKAFGVFGGLINLRNKFTAGTPSFDNIYGGGALAEYAMDIGVNNFQLLKLDKDRMAGGSNVSYHHHVPQFKFKRAFRWAFNDYGIESLEPKIMFYVDAFFQKAIQDQAAAARDSHNAKRKETLSINSNSEALSSFIYPNPSTTGKIHVEFNAITQTELDINVTNLLGQNVLHTTQQATRGVQKIPVDVSGLSNGLYILTVKGADQSISGKFIVNK